MFKLFPLKSGLENVPGFFCDAVNVGMRTNPANDSATGAIDGDVAFIRSDTPCDVAALFTKNRFQAAPLQHFQRYPEGFQTNFVLINAKNANAMTGEKGSKISMHSFTELEKRITLTHPVMSSTGVIGYRLDREKIASAFDRFDYQAKASDKTARAIMTTDSFKKELCFKVELEDGGVFHIAAICKGAGMINPAMATMLCFITTDADISKRRDAGSTSGSCRSFIQPYLCGWRHFHQ